MTTPDAATNTLASTPLSGWHYRAVVWSAVLAAAAYLGLALWGGREDISAAVIKIGAAGIAAALALSLINYGLRFLRWQMYLAAMGAAVPVWPSMRIYLAGFALTTTPAKAGEAFRGLFLKPWGVSYATSFVALLSERLSDVLAILALSALGLSVHPEARPLVLIGIAAISIVYAAASSERLVHRIQSLFGTTGKISSLIRRLTGALLHARVCHTPRMLLAATFLSLVAWTAEAWAFHLILQRMGPDIGLTLAVSIYAISMLAGALSFMPGGLGGAEAAMIALLSAAGVDMAQAISATIIIRLTTLWFAVGIGVVAMFGPFRVPVFASPKPPPG